jgi:eukaryotic-like serine/threonine-protein kinase
MARRVGRYQLHEPIASGGMAVVHLGRIVGPSGFSRTVAIKRLHPHLATDPEFVAMFLDEARLAARVQHPNVVATLDVVASDGELFLVMDYVLGASLSQLGRWAKQQGSPTPPAVVSSVIAGALYGLHAAHEAQDEGGELLAIVHRDVSPQNILVGVDGVARVVDFGVAKAASRAQSTRDDQVKGKLAYMAPEQILRKNVDRRADVYAAGVVLWEALAARRLFVADDIAAVAAMVLEGAVPRMTSTRTDLASGIDDVVKRALARDPADRFGAAIDFAAALEAAIQPAPQREVGAWVERVAGKELDARRKLVSVVERTPFLEGNDGQAIEGLLTRPKTAQEATALATALTSKLSLGLATPAEPRAAPARTPMPGGRTRRLWVGSALAFALVAGGGAFGARALRGVSSAGASSPPPPALAVPQVADETQPSTTASANSAPESIATPAATGPLRAGSPHAASHPRLLHQHAASAPPPPASPGVPSCDPPFTLDPNGVKRFKPWCL